MSTTDVHSFKTIGGAIFKHSRDDFYDVTLPRRSGSDTTAARDYPATNQIVLNRKGHAFRVLESSFGAYPVPRAGWVRLKRAPLHDSVMASY